MGRPAVKVPLRPIVAFGNGCLPYDCPASDAPLAVIVLNGQKMTSGQPTVTRSKLLVSANRL